jgi:hypothetical protein
MTSDSVGTSNESNAATGQTKWTQVAHDGKESRWTMLMMSIIGAGEKIRAEKRLVL